MMRAHPALLLVIMLAACSEPEPAREEPEGAALPVSRPMTFRFSDITSESGLDFQHLNGRDGRKLLPETMGSGAAFLDYDGDGKLDIFLVNGTSWTADADANSRGRCALFRGRGDGSFVDVSQESGADIEIQGMGCQVADVDDDGDPDVFVTGVFGNRLLKNEGGRFVDASAAAGLLGGSWRDAEGVEHPEWSTASVFFDADGDGDLDLFLCNYCEWSIETDIFTTLDGKTKAFTTPEYYRGLPCRIYLNDGKGRFEDRTEGSGLEEHRGKALGVAVWDLDGDGLEEVIVANDTRPNFLFRNLGGGRFRERGIEAGIAYDEFGRARAGMGIDIQAAPGNGDARVAIGNFAFEPVSLYRRRADGSFSSEANAAGLALSTFEPLTFGLVFADLDLDGLEDLLIVNGHIEPDIARFREQERHAQRPVFHRGLSDGSFAVMDPLPGCALEQAIVGRGLAVGDIDGDGDLDLLVTTNGGRARLYRNELVNAQVSQARALEIVLRQEAPNRAAYGAIVRVKRGAAKTERRLRGGSSYLSQSDLRLVFGLGEGGEETDIEVEVIWPDGSKSEHRTKSGETLLEIQK